MLKQDEKSRDKVRRFGGGLSGVSKVLATITDDGNKTGTLPFYFVHNVHATC
jgi:hypothetical protein